MDNGRMSAVEPATIASSGNLSGAIFIQKFATGAIITPAAWTTADIAFEVSQEDDGTFVDCVGQTGSLVKITNVTTNAAKSYPIPAEVMTHRWMKIHSVDTGDETDEAQAAARTLSVVLKG